LKYLKKWLSVIHPLLFAMFFVLALYSVNQTELWLSSIWVSLAASFGFALFLFVLSCLLFRDARKAGIITSVFIIIFFADGHVHRVLNNRELDLLGKYLPIAGALFFFGVVYLTVRTKSNLHKLTAILNVVAVCLIVISSITIAANEFRRPSYTAQIENTEVEVEPGEVDTFPDIYYIVLDGYSSSTTLMELYNYDNSEFTDFLNGKGFYIANQSTSNYAFTHLSLASSLNMEYINYLSEVAGEQSKDLMIPTQMARNNKVMTFLQSIGYQYVHFETMFEPTFHNQYADLNVQCGKIEVLGLATRNPFELLLIDTTILNRFMDRTSTSRSYVLNAFSKLAEMPELPGPKFVFAHIVCPHWPYVFGADGETVEAIRWENEPREVRMDKYLNQVKFVNKQVKILVDEILSKSQSAPIIIIQGDHGSRETCSSDISQLAQCMQDTMRIFNAYYLPYGGDEVLYSSISPVNTFRVVFNFYFGADYELLSDYSYFSAGVVSPYMFGDVTGIVRYD